MVRRQPDLFWATQRHMYWWHCNKTAYEYMTQDYFLLLHPSGSQQFFCYLALPLHLELEDIFPTDSSLWSTSLRPIILLPLTTGAFITFLHHHIQVCNVNVLILSIPVKPAHAFLSTLCSPRIRSTNFKWKRKSLSIFILLRVLPSISLHHKSHSLMMRSQ